MYLPILAQSQLDIRKEVLRELIKDDHSSPSLAQSRSSMVNLNCSEEQLKSSYDRSHLVQEVNSMKLTTFFCLGLVKYLNV